MTLRINTRYIAATLCAGLLVATLAAEPARAENGEITRTLVGLAALGLIGAAIADVQRAQRSSKSVPPRPAPAPQPQVTPAPLVAPGMARFFIPDHQTPRQTALPARCLRNVNIAGIQWLYDDTLPQGADRHRSAAGVQDLGQARQPEGQRIPAGLPDPARLGQLTRRAVSHRDTAAPPAGTRPTPEGLAK